MYCQKNLALLLSSLTACAGGVTIVPKPSEYVQKDLASYADYDRPEDSSSPVQKLLDRSQTKEAKDDIYKWWLNSAVLELEKERPMGTGELIAACLHTPPSADTYAIKGHPKPDQIYENDLRFYNVMVESNNRIADRYRLIRALTKSAEGEYSHKDDLRALA